ncbi:RNA polymerase sigma factor [Flavivirga eckloniae]|nr:RNA polymerase sigma-70 factor [Flavivirga eckloniae]
MFKDYTNNTYLVERLRKGDESAYTYLMDAFYQKLCTYANSLSRDVYVSEDIVQNVFLRIWEHRHRLKGTHSVKSYLYQSVYNEFIDQYRKRNKLIAVESEYIKALTDIVEEDASELTRLIGLVKEEIQNLPPKCKKVFLLGKQEGLTYGEIAEYLNVSFRTVENQMSKAFAIIRKNVGNRTDSILFLLFGFKHCS